MIADKQVYDGGARGLAKRAQAVIVSVDYRRASEGKFPGAIENAIAQPLKRATVARFVDKLITSKADLKGPRLQFIVAKLAGMAPATLINARINPLRSDGAKVEAVSKKTGVPVERRDYEGVTHELFGTAAVVEKAREAQALCASAVEAGVQFLTSTCSLPDFAKPIAPTTGRKAIQPNSEWCVSGRLHRCRM